MSNISSPPQAGVYTWEHPGGKFEVCLRPNFVFYCQSFPAAAVWSFQDNKLTVDWKNYGKYELILNDSDVLEGSVVGISTKWRKMSFLRPLSDAEAILFGEGGGSVWSFEYEKGVFEVEFRADGFNHFICKQYPAHSHWTVDGSTGQLDINWGKYGEYVLQYDATSHAFNGSVKGDPSKWRRARLIRSLGIDVLGDVPAHDHGHVHDSNCKH